MLDYQLHVRHLETTPSLEYNISKRVTKLEAFHTSIVKCSVTLDIEHRTAQSGKIFIALICVALPGKKTISVKKEDENIYIALYSSFDVIERLLEKHNHKYNNDLRLTQRNHQQIESVSL